MTVCQRPLITCTVHHVCTLRIKGPVNQPCAGCCYTTQFAHMRKGLLVHVTHLLFVRLASVALLDCLEPVVEHTLLAEWKEPAAGWALGMLHVRGQD